MFFSFASEKNAASFLGFPTPRLFDGERALRTGVHRKIAFNGAIIRTSDWQADIVKRIPMNQELALEFRRVLEQLGERQGTRWENANELVSSFENPPTEYKLKFAVTLDESGSNTKSFIYTTVATRTDCDRFGAFPLKTRYETIPLEISGVAPKNLVGVFGRRLGTMAEFLRKVAS